MNEVIEGRKHAREIAEKHLWLEGIKLSALIKSVKKWNTNCGGTYLSIKLKKGGYNGLNIEPTEMLQKFIDGRRCDENDTISFELIEWNNCFLLCSSNSVIISSTWLDIYSTEEVKSVFGEFLD